VVECLPSKHEPEFKPQYCKKKKKKKKERKKQGNEDFLVFWFEILLLTLVLEISLEFSTCYFTSSLIKITMRYCLECIRITTIKKK
jgi:hypothetical protein